MKLANSIHIPPTIHHHPQDKRHDSVRPKKNSSMRENPPTHLIIINEITSAEALAQPCAVMERVEEPDPKPVAGFLAVVLIVGS